MQYKTKDQLYFEDVKEGMEIPSVVRGPVSMTTIVKFAVASGDFAPIHHDIEVAKSRGLPGPVIMGPYKWSFLSQWLTDWVGPEGEWRDMDIRLTQMDLVGDTLVAKGKVTKKYTAEGRNYVECEVWLENARTGSPSITGKAQVYLPRRK